MGVMCQILLKSGNKGVYRAGETIEGVVKFGIFKPTEFASVTLSLRGKGLCYWSSMLSSIGTVYVGSEDFVEQRVDLLQTKENEPVTLQAGTYVRPFRFVLPEEIPSSYKDFRCTISYYFILKLVKPSLMSVSKKFYTEIRVQGGIKPHHQEPLITEIRKDFLSPKKFLTLKAEIEKTFVTAGEDIKLSLMIKNYSDVPITAIKTELIKYVTYKSNCKNEKRKSKTVDGTEVKYPGAKKKIGKTVLCNVLTLPDMFSMQSYVLEREYKLRITAKLPFPYKEACIEVPIVIVQKNDDFGVDMLDDEPPAYWKVMSEDKRKGGNCGGVVEIGNVNKIREDVKRRPQSCRT